MFTEKSNNFKSRILLLQIEQINLNKPMSQRISLFLVTYQNLPIQAEVFNNGLV